MGIHKDILRKGKKGDVTRPVVSAIKRDAVYLNEN
jgi:hypothetical protein